MRHRAPTPPRRGLSRTLAGTSLALGVFGVAAIAYGDHQERPPSAVAAAPTEDAPASSVPRSPVAPVTESAPLRLALPSLGVSAETMELGLQPDGALEVPPVADAAGWYTGAPTPGATGPAIIAAHVDFGGERGVFYELDELEPGDEVRVDRRDATTVRFRVERVEQYPKDQFPTEAVYGDIDHAGLRLITCGGEFDDAEDSYVDNVVVYASLIGATPA